MANKTHLNVSIDTDLLERAKIVIGLGNISSFCEGKIRERLFESGNPEMIRDKLEEIEEQKMSLLDQLDKAENAVNSKLSEAVVALLEHFAPKGEFEDRILKYWAQKVQMSNEDLKRIVMIQHNKGKKK